MLKMPLNIQKFATSGTCYTGTEYDSRFRVDWQRASVDIGANTSTINWQLVVELGHNFGSNAIKSYGVNINGTNVFGGGTWSNLGKGHHQLAAGTITIGHNSDGTKTFNINLSGWLYSNHNYSGSQDFQLDTLPRHFTQQPKITLQTQETTNCVFKWETSETCNWIRYKLDGSSSHVDVFSGSATSGTFTIENLQSNTNHSVYAEARRQDSGLWSNSNTLNFSTSSKTGKIRINGEDKEATPYVRINGEWKVAVPFTRNNNEWKRGK